MGIAPMSSVYKTDAFLLSYTGMVIPAGFEPASKGPRPKMLDRYTTGLYVYRYIFILKNTNISNDLVGNRTQV